MFKKLILTMAIASISINSFALGDDENKNINNDSIKASFQNFFGGNTISYIADAKLENTYLVLLNDGTKMIYFKDTNYAVVGDLYDLKNRKNMTNTIMADYNKEIISKIKDKGINYPVKDGVNKLDTVYVFTDPSCGYCRKLHNELEEYLSAGINIVYLPYSRSGENTKSYTELVDVWCSVDKKAAIDMAKNDKEDDIKAIEGYKLTEECSKIVADGESYGRKLGIQGTPALFSSNGTAFPGYLPAYELKKYLEELK